MEKSNNIESRFCITETKGKDLLSGNQGSLLDKFKKIIKGKSLKTELEEIKKIILKNQPNYSDKDILELAKEISASGCTYVAAANSILEQLDYDEDKFYEYFGFAMRNKKGELNHDMLIAELYSFMKDRIELDIRGKYEVLTFEDLLEAAEKIIGQIFTDKNEAFKAIIASGYQIDGTKYTKFIKRPKLLMGNYKELSKKLLGDIKVDSIEEFKQRLTESGFGFGIKDYSNPVKLSSLSTGNFDKWMNYYFLEKDIDLEYISESIEVDNYDSLIEDIKNRMQAGETITIGVGHRGENIGMTDGSRLGWFNFSSVLHPGHAMPFVGISEQGDFIVSSWGEKYMLPKEFYNYLDVYSRKVSFKILEKNISANESKSTVITENYFEQDFKCDSIYEYINDKIEYISAILTKTSPAYYESKIGLLSKQLFTDEEIQLIKVVKPLIKNENGDIEKHFVFAILNGEEYIYKIYNQANGFVDVPRDYFENLIITGQMLDDGTIPGIGQLKR